MTSPTLYISYYLKKNWIEYYDRLTEVRNKGNFEQWVNFFLQAICVSAEDVTNTIDTLTVLHNKNLAVIEKMGRGAKTAKQLFAYLKENPIIEIQKTAVALNTTFNTISGAVNRLCAVGILRQAAGDRRNRTFAYEDYIEILRNGS